MKFLLVLVALIVTIMAQRPMYAGTGPRGRPGLASRFKTDEDTSSSTVAIYNRVGIDGTTARIPIDARGDGELVDRLNQWPRENRPFWLLNADHIEASRNRQGNQGPLGTRGNPDIASRNALDSDFSQSETRTIRPNQPRSSFLGALRR